MDRFEQQLADFWSLIQDVWVSGVAGVDFGRILAAIGILLVFLVLRGLFTRFVLGSLRRLANRTDSALDDMVLEALYGPVRLIPVILGLFIALDYLQLQDPYTAFSAQLIRTLVVFDLFW